MKNFIHKIFSNENFIARKFPDLRYTVALTTVYLMYKYTSQSFFFTRLVCELICALINCHHTPSLVPDPNTHMGQGLVTFVGYARSVTV